VVRVCGVGVVAKGCELRLQMSDLGVARVFDRANAILLRLLRLRVNNPRTSFEQGVMILPNRVDVASKTRDYF